MDRLRIALNMVRKNRFFYEETPEGVVFSYCRKSYKIDIVLRINLDGNRYHYTLNKAGKRTYVFIPFKENSLE